MGDFLRRTAADRPPLDVDLTLMYGNEVGASRCDVT